MENFLNRTGGLGEEFGRLCRDVGSADLEVLLPLGTQLLGGAAGVSLRVPALVVVRVRRDVQGAAL